jgi:hypothetical protein
MPDYELFIAAEDVARAGGDAVETQWLPQWRPGRFGPDPSPDSDRIPAADHLALADLWKALGGDDVPEDIVNACECVYGEESADSDGPWVWGLPQDLVDRLAALTSGQVRPAAEAWARTETFQDFKPTPELEPVLAGLVRLLRHDREEAQRRREDAKVREVEEILTRVVRLVQRAKQTGKGVYLYCEL